MSQPEWPRYKKPFSLPAQKAESRYQLASCSLCFGMGMPHHPLSDPHALINLTFHTLTIKKETVSTRVMLRKSNTELRLCTTHTDF